VSEELFAFLASTLLFAFIICCTVSAALQVVAWSRHAREGVPVSLRALWKPDGHFDEIGLRQIHIARRLLLVGGMAYLSFGALNVLATLLG
jgi:hypothetical protein